MTLGNNISAYDECKYILKCNQTKKLPCITYPKSCVVYQHFENQEHPMAKLGLERFLDKKDSAILRGFVWKY